jgi:hypothetical protein
MYLSRAPCLFSFLLNEGMGAHTRLEPGFYYFYLIFILFLITTREEDAHFFAFCTYGYFLISISRYLK